MCSVTRGVYRAQLTKLANSAIEFLAKETNWINSANEANFDDMEEELVAFIDRIAAINENLLRANADIRPSIKTEELKKELESVAEYEDKSMGVLSRLKQRLSKLREYRNPVPTHNDTIPIVQTRLRGDQQTMMARLPKLTLRTFSGEFQEWLPFWEVFRTAVHERQELSGAEKFNYLQIYLKGRAANSIAGFIPTDENYDAAIALLQEEYGDKEKLIDFTIQRLMQLNSVHSKSDVVGLRRLYNNVTTHTRSLTALGVSHRQYSVMLKSQLLKCIPNELVVEFYRSHHHEETVSVTASGDAETQGNFGDNGERESLQCDDSSSVGYLGDRQVRDILKFMKREVESLERSAQFHSKKNIFQSSEISPKPTMGFFASASSLKCCFCHSVNHILQQCDSDIPLAQRKEILKKENRCFRCLNKGHNSKFCKVRNLKCAKCSGRHVSFMCDPSFSANFTQRVNSKVNKRETSQTSNQTTSLCSSSSSTDIFLQTACVCVENPIEKRSLTARILLDGGSQRTFITQSVASKLKLKVLDRVNVRILPFGSTNEITSSCLERVRVNLKNRHTEQRINIIAVVVPSICVDVLPTPDVASLQNFSHSSLADSNSNALEEVGLSVLIGVDYYWQIVTGELIRLTSNAVAMKSIFGWIIQGPFSNRAMQKISHPSSCTAAFNVTMKEDESCCIKRLWDLESLGITAENNDKQTVNYNDYIQKVGNRFEGALLWNKTGTVLDSFRYAASNRFKKLIAKLSRQPNIFKEYEKAMWELISAGIAERVNDNSCENVYYMPHHPVYKEESTTTKLRIVFDASAHTQGNLSLNASLNSGPNLLPDILSILLKFRIGKFALVADIEKAFLQIMLAPRDRDFHRFFWFERIVPDLSNLPKTTEYRMTRVTFGVTCSPFLLCSAIQALISDNVESFPETCEVLKNSFYMDDLVASVNNMEAARKTFSESNLILKQASFKIRKWNSNNVNLRKMFDAPAPPVQKVLGIIWNNATDNLSFDVDKLIALSQQRCTKRHLLRFIGSIYDPLGLLGPYVIKFKILFQEVWRCKLGWDECLPPELETVWNAFSAQVHFLKDIVISRWAFPTDGVNKRELHLFADASSSAYGTIAYVRNVTKDNISITPLCAKSRVAPLKGTTELTLPKLELTAALLASRLANYLLNNLNINFDVVYLWSDSAIALHWIKGEAQKFKPYISHRVHEIQKLTSGMTWAHCPGKENPADALTRGVKGKDMLNNTLWNCGPVWLADSADNWPKVCLFSVNKISSSSLQIQTENLQESFIDIEKFSCYRRLLRTTAYVIRFIHSLRGERASSKFLKSSETADAEQLWIKRVQATQYRHEISVLKLSKPIAKTSEIFDLHPFLDEKGIIRLQSRLEESGFDYDTVFPIILPRSSYFTYLLIVDVHSRTLHGGVNATLARLRERFWVVRARQVVKSIAHRCLVCARYTTKPATQPFAPLPRDRLQFARPFEAVGIDFAGPFYVFAEKNDKASKKVYMLLITCAAIRAIHLELVSSLTAEHCILALRRFFARRGIPKMIYSDNARTFKRAAVELRGLTDIIQSQSLENFILKNGVSWKFIVERAAWWGGFWERLIKEIKQILKIVIHRAVISMEELQTLLVEIEGTLNNRPLTYISEDPLDLTPLTPNHFLAGVSQFSTSIQINERAIRAAWKNRLKLLGAFIKRFKIEYLQRLRSAHHNGNCFTKNLNVGDVVILYDQIPNRAFWKLAVVEKTYPGRDGKIRACEIRLGSGTVLRRAIQHLYPLEVRSSVSLGPPEDVKNSEEK